MTTIIGEGSKSSKKKMVAPALGKYFNAEYVVDVVYRNGGLAPGGSGNVMTPVSFGCGVNQEEFMMLLTFYGGMMVIARKDPLEAEEIMEEIGKNIIEHYKIDLEDKKWIEEKFIQKKKKEEIKTEEKKK
jgi:hypothetical protein